jgi:Domain of unknown function (DUF4440)
MMTDDLTFMHANAAVETKAEFLDALKTGRYKYQSLTDEERRVRVHGDTGIVSGTCRILVTASGKDIDIRVAFTELWVKERGAWRMPPLAGDPSAVAEHQLCPYKSPRSLLSSEEKRFLTKRSKNDERQSRTRSVVTGANLGLGLACGVQNR